MPADCLEGGGYERIANGIEDGGYVCFDVLLSVGLIAIRGVALSCCSVLKSSEVSDESLRLSVS